MAKNIAYDRCMLRGRALLSVLAGVALLQPGTAAARDYYYFNKPGVDRQAYLADRIACEELAGGAQFRRPDMTVVQQQTWANPNLTTGQAAAAAGIGALVLAFTAAAERRRLTWQVERICLADKGYRRFEMHKQAFKAIERTKDVAARIDSWFALATTSNPQGKEMYE